MRLNYLMRRFRQAAVANMRVRIEKEQTVVSENRAIIQKAEAAITDATVQLKTANATLKIVNKIGG
jgi:hypothetical protein